VVEREGIEVRMVGRTGKFCVAPRMFIEVTEYQDDEMVKTCVGELLFKKGFESFGFVWREAWAGDPVGAVWAEKSDGGKASVWVTKGVVVGNASVP
jgi:hypothetical protein